MDSFIIVFSGHMIDTPDRTMPRFPKEQEAPIRNEMKKKLIDLISDIRQEEPGNEDERLELIGIAGGANGGDILFHEICQELDIKTYMLLGLPKEEYISRSILPGGVGWVDRFNALVIKPNISVHVYSESQELPELEVSDKEDYTIWQLNNLWILDAAKKMGGNNLALLALWDGKTGDGAGGTKHMIEEIEKVGAKSVIISP